MQLSFLSLLMIVAIAGCANPYAVMRDANRAALSRVEVGMTKSEVETIMGQRAAEGILGRFENPYKRETIRGTDGTSYDVWSINHHNSPALTFQCTGPPTAAMDRDIRPRVRPENKKDVLVETK